MSALSVADVLDRAADIINERGWTQGEWQRRDDRCVCIEGAITYAACLHRFVDADRSPAGLFMEKVLKAEGFAPDMPAWNDAPGRTQAEVVAKLREAASLARQQSEGAGL